MAVDFKSPADSSTTELVAGILSDAQDLMKQQFDLLRHEVLDDLRKTRDAAILFGLGAGLSLVGGILLTMMLVHVIPWLFPDFPLWGSFGVWGVAAVLMAGALFYKASRKLASFRLPEQSAQAFKENVQWITHPK